MRQEVSRRAERGVEIIDLYGTFYASEEGEAISKAIRKAIAARPAGILVNYQNVAEMTGGNYGVFLQIIRDWSEATRNKIPLKLLFPLGWPERAEREPRISYKLRNWMRLLPRLSEILSIHDDEAAAIESFLAPPAEKRPSLALVLDPDGRVGVRIIDHYAHADVAETRQVEPALHGIWLPSASVFPRSELAAFEALINQEPPAPEREFQAFFEAHPKWLFMLGEQYEQAVSQIRLPPLEMRTSLMLTDREAERVSMIPDFLLKRVGLELWDVLDIKTTDARVIVGDSARRRFSSAVGEAVAQLREYTRRLKQSPVRDYLFEQHGLTMSEPMPMVLIGRDFHFANAVEKDQFRESEDVRVYTYDDLYRLARARAIE